MTAVASAIAMASSDAFLRSMLRLRKYHLKKAREEYPSCWKMPRRRVEHITKTYPASKPPAMLAMTDQTPIVKIPPF